MNLFNLFKKTVAETPTKRLQASEWGEIHNPSQTEKIVRGIKAGNLSIQTKEILKIVKKGEKVLEIGSGSGQSSVCLAMIGALPMALDFEQKCLDLTSAIAEKLNVEVSVIKADAEKPLPFKENQFDFIFHAGLLEHYDSKERINLLRMWKPYSKKMISMVPNASSLPYRVGKALMEQGGTWKYGIENPIYSAREEFIKAGYEIENEYTIGEEHSLSFLPDDHYLKGAIAKWIKENPCEDNCGQGYLLVTIGVKKQI